MVGAEPANQSAEHRSQLAGRARDIWSRPASAGGLNQTFQSSAQVLLVGVFFTLMIAGLAASYNPLQHLAGPHVLSSLSAHRQATVTGRGFFPHLISTPFRTGLHEPFVFAIAACLIAAAASLLRGNRAPPHGHSSPPPTRRSDQNRARREGDWRSRGARCAAGTGTCGQASTPTGIVVALAPRRYGGLADQSMRRGTREA
jgi:hypothetical protein